MSRSCWIYYWHGSGSPEKALAAFAGHGVEVESSGLVSADAADPRGVAVKLIRSLRRCAHGHGLHNWKTKEKDLIVTSISFCIFIQLSRLRVLLKGATAATCQRRGFELRTFWSVVRSDLLTTELILDCISFTPALMNSPIWLVRIVFLPWRCTIETNNTHRLSITAARWDERQSWEALSCRQQRALFSEWGTLPCVMLALTFVWLDRAD